MTIASGARDLFPILICCLAAAWDIRKREIPDSLSLALVIGTLCCLHVSNYELWWSHLLGGLTALMVTAALSRNDRFGGGDVKLFSSLSMWFGLSAVLPLACWIALAGLPLSILAALRRQRDLAYAPAILAGVCVHSWQP
ncbi:MAG: A24 family peptidase, partial [Planctomycetota bacterium]